MENIDFLPIFKKELDEEVQRVTELILRLEKDPGEEEILRSLMREFHTIKGAARAIQFDEIKNVAHSIEDIYHALLDGKVEQRESLIDLTLHAIDLIQALLDAHLEGKPFDAHQGLPDLVNLYLAGNDPEMPCLKEDDSTSQNKVVEEEYVSRPFEQTESTDKPHAESPEEVPEQEDSSVLEKVEPQEGDRVERTFADSLLNLSGEITVAVGSLEDQRRTLQKLSKEFAYLTRELDRMEGSDGRNLSSEAKIFYRLRSVQGIQNQTVENLDITETRLRILSEQLDSQVTRARLVPLKTLFSTYPRLVRDLSRELQKECDLEITGQDTRIDQGVLIRVRTSLMHLMRNALDHGIEAPDVRKKKGKPARGRIRIEAMQLGSLVRIKVSDDGAGIDMDRLKQKVLSRGDTSHEIWDEMDRSEREQFLSPGLLHSAEGFGNLGPRCGPGHRQNRCGKGGRAGELENRPGHGTSFILELPLTLSLTPCILVQGGKVSFFGVQHYAFPLRDVEEVGRIRATDLRTVEGREAIRYGEETILLFDFASIMGLSPLRQNRQEKHLLILNSGTRRIGLLVEAVFDEQHIVTRRIASRLGKIRHVEAVTVMNDGNLALIVDVKDLLQEVADVLISGGSFSSHLTDPEEADSKVRHVLVVEDSQTVREVVHFLQSAGYRVTTAVNGIDGLNKLKADSFDIVISDIDMPRMNGIEMIRQIRSDQKYKDLPIIIVSYKDREEDRKKALEAGINLYVTKSEFDSAEMLVRIGDLLPPEPGKPSGTRLSRNQGSQPVTVQREAHVVQ